MEKTYNPDAIEQHWYQTWEGNGNFKPSGEGTPYAIMYDVGGVNCADMTGADRTCGDPELVELVENVRYAKNLEEREEAVRELQQYYKEELPMIALVWGKDLYPYRTDRFTEWVIQDGYGNMNFETWFSLEPVS